MENTWILAQADTDAGPAQPPKITSDQPGGATEPIIIQPGQNGTGQEPGPKKEQPGGYTHLLFLGLIFVMLYFVLFRGPRKKQQQQRRMIQDLKKNDRVRTIGGVIGTIVDIKDDEITLKIDETNNTKMKIITGAVSRNLSQD